jgi:hypothetical protein
MARPYLRDALKPPICPQSKGKKPLDLEAETMKRLKLDKEPVMNYDQNFGKIKFIVAAGTSEAEDNQAENEKADRLTGN